MGAGRLPALVQTCLPYGPIRLREKAKEMVWLYEVREDHDAQTPPARPYVVFTSGHAPFQGDARADVARADFSNFPPQTWLKGSLK